jgi:long-chain acyl-CoA synthetase
MLEEFRGDLFAGEWPTLPELFRISARRFPGRPCFTVYEPGRISLSYAEAIVRIEAVARWLAAKGVRAGDKVAVTGKNAPEWAVAYLGALFAGAVVVPIDYQLRNEETANLIRAADAKILFVDEEKYAYFAATPGGLEAIAALKRGDGDYIYDLDGPAAAADAVSVAAADTDLAAILFTSGTTGTPKGVMLSHRNLTADCFLAQSNLHLYPTDVFYALLPIHHSYTMLAVFIEAISVGAEVVFGKKMVVKQIFKELKEAKVTMFLGVPMLFNKVLAGINRGVKEKGPVAWILIRSLMALSGFVKKVFKANPGKALFKSILDKVSLSTVRICISGGGPLAPTVFKQYNQFGLDFIQGYGLTETSPILTLNPVEHYKETSVGKLIARVEMKILDPDERGVGEIAVKGPMVMQGYYKMPAETAAMFTADGWLKTGDLGYLDDENYLYLTGRAKNLIVTEGGKNVYPEEIENEFQLYEEIEQVLVRGYVADKKLQVEGIEALVYPNRDAFKDAGADAVAARIEAIVAEVNQRLLAYQKIEKTTVLDAPMEMTTTKKIKRSAV